MPSNKNKRRNNNGKRSANRNSNKGMSTEGKEFLKCAYAPVDFAGETPCPVPDGSGARVTVKRHKLVASITSTAGQDTYIVVPPIPGRAFYANTVATGTSPNGTNPFAQVQYPDTATLMPSGSAGINFIKFRYVSSYIELVPTINATTWSGSVTAWKGTTSIETSSSSSNGAISQYVQGMSAVSQPSQSMYVAGNNLGMYMVATQVGPWTYTDIIDNLTNPASNNTLTDPQLNGQCVGFGNVETMFIRITGTFSYTIKVGCCVEYVVNSNSALYEYSRLNNVIDAKAIMLYRQIASQLPLAVSYYENPDFWKRVLQLIAGIGGAMSTMSGPAGLIGGGVGLMAGGIGMLL